VTDLVDDRLWAAIAEPTRLRILDVLVVKGDATPTTLAKELPFTRQAVSKHLVVLVDAGLVDSRRQGREVRFTVRSEGVDAAAKALQAAATRWDRSLREIRRIAESVQREATSPS
jgi:DNA-binding transcriptional ArsR family regulator